MATDAAGFEILEGQCEEVDQFGNRCCFIAGHTSGHSISKTLAQSEQEALEWLTSIFGLASPPDSA